MQKFLYVRIFKGIISGWLGQQPRGFHEFCTTYMGYICCPFLRKPWQIIIFTNKKVKGK